MARSLSPIVPLVALMLLAIAGLAHASFDGTWKDNDGRILTLCTTSGSTLQGSYQEFGLIQGQISGNIASGNFYAALHPSIGCRVRSFSWTLQPSNNQLNGTWVCSEKNLHGNWNAVRESTFTSPTACGVLATSGSLAGSWNDFWQAPTTTSSWDFCVDSTTYNSSYEFIGATTGKSGIAYAYGNLFANGLIGIGLYSENANVISSDNHAGVNIIALGSDGQLFGYFWDLPSDDNDVLELNPNKHRVIRVSRFSSNTVATTTCERNKAVGIFVAAPGAASTLTASIAMIGFVVVGLLSVYMF